MGAGRSHPGPLTGGGCEAPKPPCPPGENRPFSKPENLTCPSLSVQGRGRMLPLEILNGAPQSSGQVLTPFVPLLVFFCFFFLFPLNIPSIFSLWLKDQRAREPALPIMNELLVLLAYASVMWCLCSAERIKTNSFGKDSSFKIALQRAAVRDII